MNYISLEENIRIIIIYICAKQGNNRDKKICEKYGTCLTFVVGRAILNNIYS